MCSRRVLVLLLILFPCFSCSKTETRPSEVSSQAEELSGQSEEASGQAEELPPLSEAELPDLAEAIARFSREAAAPDPDREAFVEDFWRWICGEAGIPEELAQKIAASVLESPAFIFELLEILQQDPYTYYLVDKQHALPDNYEPDDLLPLTDETVRLAREGLSLRSIAFDALKEMSIAAAADGITFTVGSTYRSAAYQAQVYEREVKTYGQETADRESAQPGKSQHQLGLTLDFSPIDDAFAETPASRWLLANAGKFGWSISFPDAYESVTGYRWESWHYRYVGKELAVFIDKYFDGIQQYALQFINAWREQAGE